MCGFFSTPDPKEQIRGWKRDLRSQSRQVDREIRGIEREQKKVEKSLKDAAKRGDKTSMGTLARSIVQSKASVSRLHSTKATLNSCVMKMDEAMATIKMGGTFKTSAILMRDMNRLMSVSSISRVMEGMSREMMKAGILEEMTDEMTSEVLGDEEISDEDVEEAVNAVMQEVLGPIVSPPTSTSATVPASTSTSTTSIPTATTTSKEPIVEEQIDPDTAKLQARLAALAE